MAGRWGRGLSAKGRLKLRKHFASWNDRVFLTKHVNEDDDRYLLGLRLMKLLATGKRNCCLGRSKRFGDDEVTQRLAAQILS